MGGGVLGRGGDLRFLGGILGEGEGAVFGGGVLHTVPPPPPPVKDKEDTQVDSEARPMKDETFGEYR